MLRKIPYLLFSLFAATSLPALADLPGNTATGEAPAEVAERVGMAETQKIKESGTDRQRWQRLILFSDSKDSSKLEMPLVAAANFRMQLQPQKGYLGFSQNGKTDLFEAAVPHGTKNNVCPAYQFSVLSAEPGMALVRKICPGFEYDARPGKKAKYHLEVDYLLYDAQTATLALLWRNVQSTNGGPDPVPEQQPKVRRLPNGYELDWRAVDPVENRKFQLHTRYTVEKVDGRLQLVCTDLNAPKGEQHAANCENGMMPRVQ